MAARDGDSQGPRPRWLRHSVRGSASKAPPVRRPTRKRHNHSLNLWYDCASKRPNGTQFTFLGRFRCFPWFSKTAFSSRHLSAEITSYFIEKKVGARQSASPLSVGYASAPKGPAGLAPTPPAERPGPRGTRRGAARRPGRGRGRPRPLRPRRRGRTCGSAPPSGTRSPHSTHSTSRGREKPRDSAMDKTPIRC